MEKQFVEIDKEYFLYLIEKGDSETKKKAKAVIDSFKQQLVDFMPKFLQILLEKGIIEKPDLKILRNKEFCEYVYLLMQIDGDKYKNCVVNHVTKSVKVLEKRKYLIKRFPKINIVSEDEMRNFLLEQHTKLVQAELFGQCKPRNACG